MTIFPSISGETGTVFTPQYGSLSVALMPVTYGPAAIAPPAKLAQIPAEPALTFAPGVSSIRCPNSTANQAGFLRKIVCLDAQILVNFDYEIVFIWKDCQKTG